jgi:hypothetical protein
MTPRLALSALLPLAVAATAGSARADDPSATWPHVDVSVARVVGLPRLEAQSRDAWSAVGCVLPCAARLDPALSYRIAGDGVVDSDPFHLPAGADHVRVDVVPGSTMGRGMGSLLAVSGLVFAAGGGTLLLWPSGSASSDEKTRKTAIGIGMISLGAIAAAVGIVVHAVSDTSVSVSPAASAPGAS